MEGSPSSSNQAGRTQATLGVDQTTGVISINNATPAGTHTITIRATDNCGATTDTSFTLTVGKANQTITFGALANKNVGDPDFSVNATATSGLRVSFAASGQCTVSRQHSAHYGRRLVYDYRFASG
jgi:hypothetical protein